MKVRTLSGENFLSFKEIPPIDLMGMGLVLLEGSNLTSRSADNNGSGKTNFQEALFWCLFGKTTKDLPVDGVINETIGKNCKVSVVLEDEDKALYQVSRFRKCDGLGDGLFFYHLAEDGSSITLNGVDAADTQRKIDNFLGASFQLCCNSVYLPQHNVKPFSTFTDKQIKDVLMEGMDLGRFHTALEKFRADIKTLREEIKTLQGRKDRMEEELAATMIRLDEYLGKASHFSLEKSSRLAAIDVRIGDLHEKIAKLKDMVKIIESLQGSEADKARELLSRKIIQDDIDALTKKSTPLKDSFRMLGLRDRELERSLRDSIIGVSTVEKKIGTNCRECGKPITPEDVAAILEAIQIEIAGLTTKKEGVKTVMVKAETAIKEFDSQQVILAKKIEVFSALEESVRAIQRDIVRLQAQTGYLAGFERDMEKAKFERASIEVEANPFGALSTAEKAKVTELTPKIKEVAEAIEKSLNELQYLEFWEVGYGYSGIPSFLLDGATPFLNEKSTHYATIATSGEVEIEFQTTSKTKKGAVKDKFAISISHQSGSKHYKGASGGERKRADICINQAMQDLIRSYGKRPLDIAFYDEPFEHIDAKGVPGIIDMLEEVAKEVGTVLVVTHSPELKSLFKKSIKVVKEKDGFSRLIL